MLLLKKYRYVLKIVQAEIGCISLELRKAYTNKHIGESKVIDKVLWRRAKTFLLGVQDDEVYSEDEINVESEVNKIIPIDILNQFISDNEEINKIALKLYMKSENIRDLNNIQLIYLIRNFLRLKKLYKKKYDFFRIIHMHTIKLTFDHFIKIVSISIPILVVGSLLRISIFCFSFGFRIEDAYDINDFISTSITSLLLSIWPLIISLVVISILEIEDSGRDQQSILIENRNINGQAKYLVPIYVLFTTIAYILVKQYYSIISVIFFPIIVFILPRIIIRYFDNFKIVFFATVFIINFATSMVSSTLQNVQNIKKDVSNKRYMVTFNKEMPYNKTMVYIERTSKGVLFYEYLNNKVIIVSDDLISCIEIRN